MCVSFFPARFASTAILTARGYDSLEKRIRTLTLYRNAVTSEGLNCMMLVVPTKQLKPTDILNMEGAELVMNDIIEACQEVSRSTFSMSFDVSKSLDYFTAEQGVYKLCVGRLSKDGIGNAITELAEKYPDYAIANVPNFSNLEREYPDCWVILALIKGEDANGQQTQPIGLVYDSLLPEGCFQFAGDDFHGDDLPEDGSPVVFAEKVDRDHELYIGYQSGIEGEATLAGDKWGRFNNIFYSSTEIDPRTRGLLPNKVAKIAEYFEERENGSFYYQNGELTEEFGLPEVA